MNRDRIEELPPLLQTVSLVGESAGETASNIRSLERPPPNLYGPARDLFFAVIGGETFDWALAQARAIAEDSARKQALAVLPLLRPYLERMRGARRIDYGEANFRLPNGLAIPIRPIWVLEHHDDEHILVANFWERPLTLEQERAAATILRHSILTQKSRLGGSGLHWISVEKPRHFQNRHFSLRGWHQFELMSDDRLARFLDRLRQGWDRYQSEAQSQKPLARRTKNPDLFDRPTT